LICATVSALFNEVAMAPETMPVAEIPGA